MCAAMSQKEYLKKYLGTSDGEKKKKKKDKAPSHSSKGMRIIEDSLDFKTVPFGYKDEDDRPTVAEVTYDDPKLKALEEFEASKKWKKMENSSASSWSQAQGQKETLSPVRKTRHDSRSPPRKMKGDNKGDVGLRKGRHDTPSPPRKGKKDTVIRRPRQDSESPPRRLKHNLESPRRARHDTDSSASDTDHSPPHQSRFTPGSPQARRTRHDSPDAGLAFIRGRHESDLSSPPRKMSQDSKSPKQAKQVPREFRHMSDSPRGDVDHLPLPNQDLNEDSHSSDGAYTPPYPPPDRIRNELPSSITEAGKKKAGSSSTPRKQDREISTTPKSASPTKLVAPPAPMGRKRHDSDLSLRPQLDEGMQRDSNPSPPLQLRKRQEFDESPSRPVRKRHDSDTSPPRPMGKRREFDESPPRPIRKRHDSDTSPPRPIRKRHDSDTSPPRPIRKRHDSDTSPPRPMRRKHQDSENSPPRRQNLTSTGGKKLPIGGTSRWDKASDNEKGFEDDVITLSDSSDVSSSKKYKDVKFQKKLPKEARGSLAQLQMDYQKQPKKTRTEDKIDRDSSLPRRKRHDSNFSPPRAQRFTSDSPAHQRYDSDASPPRQKRHDSDSSPVRKNKHSDSDASPPRIKKQKSGHSSPSRKGEWQEGGTVRPERKMTTQEYLSARKKGRLKKETPEDIARKEREAALQQQAEDKHQQWKHGVKQVQEYKNKIASDMHEMGKAFTRTADDVDMNAHLKSVARKEDPMLEYLGQKEAKTNRAPLKPVYKGSFPPNRLNIRPGYRWDGVDRSNGFEKRWFENQNNKRAHNEDAYKWSVSDM